MCIVTKLLLVRHVAVNTWKLKAEGKQGTNVRHKLRNEKHIIITKHITKAPDWETSTGCQTGNQPGRT